MTEKHISYKVNGDTYNIPESLSSGFEKKYPTATIEMHVGEDIYDIPLEHKAGFLNKFSDAVYTFGDSGEPEQSASLNEEVKFEVPEYKTEETSKEKSFWERLAENPAQSALAIQNAKSPKEKPSVDTDIANLVVESHVKNQERIADFMAQHEQEYASKKSSEPKKKMSFWESIAANPNQSAVKIVEKEMGQEYADAKIAQNIASKTEDKVQQYKDPAKTFVGGVVQGIGDTVFDLDTWDSTVGLEQAQRVYAITKKLDNGESLTDGEQLIVDALVDDLASDMYLASGFGRGYKAGMVTGESLPFMVETMLNPASGTGKAITKKFGKEILERVGKKLGTTAAKAALAGTRVAGDVAGAMIMSATSSQPRVMADALDRLSGEVDFTISEDGDFVFNGFTGGEDSMFKAYGKAYGSNTIQHFSEMVGDYFAPIGKTVGGLTKDAAIKISNKYGLKKINGLLTEMTPNGFGSLMNDFIEKTQWHGILGEFSEEMVGSVMDALIVGDQTLKRYDENGNINPNYVFEKDAVIDTFLGVSILGGFMSAVKTVGYTTPETRHNREIERAKKNLSKQFSEADVRVIEAFANNPFGSDYANLSPYFGNNRSKEEKTALAEYLKAVMEKKGYEISKNASLSGTQQGMEEMKKAFQFGQSMSEADLYDVTEEEARAFERLMNTGYSDVTGVSSYDLFRFSQDANLSEEQQIALHDLAVIRNAREGLEQKLSNIAHLSIMANTKIANGAAHNGVITLGKYNGKNIYVKGGVTVSNGSIAKPEFVIGYPVQIVDQMTGETTTVESDDISNVYAMDVADYNSQMRDIIETSFQQRWNTWRNKKSVRSKLAEVEQLVGQKVFIDTGNGMAEVEIKQILPNGEVLIHGKKGDLGGQSDIRVDVDSFYDSMSRDANGVVIYDQSKFRSQTANIDEARKRLYGQTNQPTETTTGQPVTEEAPKPAVTEGSVDYMDSEQTIIINGVKTKVNVENQDDSADRVTYSYTDENGQTKIGSSTISGFTEAIKQAEQFTEEPPVVEPPVSEEPVPFEPEAPVAPVEPAPAPQPTPAAPTGPVAPIQVENPIESAQIEEDKLEAMLVRGDLTRNEKRDWAYKFGKKIADMFATREDYEDYEAIATYLGEYHNDFQRGVDESFANRPQNTGVSQGNPVSLTTEPKGGNNGTEAGPKTPEGAEGYNGESGGKHTNDQGGKEGTQETEGIRGGDTNQEVKYPARKGDATRQLLTDTFGFTSVSPGVSQENLNHIYDFLMEMSKMLGISPTSISHGATLGVGVMGEGRTSTLARYEYRGYVDGTIKEPYLRFKNSLLSSVAHEWWHSLDQALSYYETGKGKQPATVASADVFTGRAEVLQAVRDVLKAINKSGHKERLNTELAYNKSFLDYSKQKKELAARFFEGYIKSKFAEAGIEVKGFAQTQTNTPTDAELKGVIPAFDNLFKVLQEKAGKKEGSTVLYQISKEMDAISDVKKELGTLVANWIKQGGNFVVVDNAAMQQALAENNQTLETPDGVVYGFVKDGTVYLNPSLINPNTAVHEYTHLWDNALMQLNPELWKRGKELMKKTSLWKEVINDPDYADIKDDEDLVASEVHSRLVGTKGAEKLNQLEQEARAKGLTKGAKELSIIGRLREWLNEATQWLRDAFTKWTSEEAATVTLSDFVNMPLRDLANFTKLPTEGIISNSNGDVVANNNGNGRIQFSISTWENGGRDYLENWLNNDKTLEADEKANILARMDEFYKNAQNYTDVYVPFGTWSDAAVRFDSNGNPLMSVIKANGDYAMNLDFSLVCKKRRPLNRLLRTLINRNAFAKYILKEREIAEINWILQEHGFEVACALCFVDSKRYRVTNVADVFAALYNKMVKTLAPKGAKIAHFNYNNNPNVEVVENGIDTMPDDQLNWDAFDKLAKKFGPNTVEGKVAAFLRDNPSQRKLVDSTDFIEAEGFEAVKANNPALLSLYNSKKGTGGPKASFGDVQYLNDILKKEKMFDPEKAYAVGGVRLQSFSDFVPHMYFDYMQLFAELAAKKLPAHAYTKEALFAKIFGLSGIKINMSLVPAVAKDGIAAGLDANGNYVWADAVRDKDGNIIQQAQSFDYNEAVAIQNAEGYSKNCGIIAVGISDAQIMKMLDDPNIPFIIPYHKSSLNAIVARMTNIDQYKDYTKVQNTRKADGSKLPKGTKDFSFNEYLHSLGENGTPQQAAKAYLDWCKENNYIPKFNEFAGHPNYYKLLVDFNTIDTKTGEYTPQSAVTMTFPTSENAFGDVEALIQQGLGEDAAAEEKMDAEMEQVADEVEDMLKRVASEPKMSEKKKLQQMAKLADERKAQIEARAAESDGILFRSGNITEEVDAEYIAAVERGDMETAQRLVDEAADNYLNEMLLPNDDDVVGFKYHRGPAPKKTFKRYAVFNVTPEGFKAAYAGNKTGTPVGVWLDAQNLESYISDMVQFDDGTFATYIAGDTGAATSTKFSKERAAELGIKGGQRWLLERGGKHSSDVPNFSQMNLKQNENGEKVASAKEGALPHNKLIFEIEYGISEDGDLTDYVRENGRIIKGKNQGLAKIGPNQYYDFKTNPNAVGNWGIGGTFRITRLVPYSEIVSVTEKYKQDAIAEANRLYENGEISQKDRDTRIKNAEDIQVQKWVGGYNPADFGLSEKSVKEMAEKGSKMKLTDPVTYDDAGNVIPLSQRFNPEVDDLRYRKGEFVNFSESKEEFDQKVKNAAGNTGVVRDGLNELSFPITNVEMHDFEGEHPADEARDWAKKNLVTTKEDKQKGRLPKMIDGTPYEISNKAISKYLSGKAIGKSNDFDAHLSVLKSLKDVISNSIDVEIHPDYIKEDGSRTTKKYGDNVLIHRLYGAISIDGKVYRVKTTMQEFRGNESGRPHSYEVTKIELLDSSMKVPERAAVNGELNPNNSISSAKLLNGVEKSYDKGKYLLEESKRVVYPSDIQNAAVDYLSGDARLKAIENAVNKEAEALNVKVTYKTREQMQKGHKYDKGYYDTKTGEVVICTENASSIADAIQTILHEAVAHKGLRQLMGEKFNEFINRVYNSLDADTKAKVDALAAEQYDGNTAVAMEEYMATLAESTNFKSNSVWDKIKSIFEEIINAILGRNDIKIGDNELRYILRASYNNMVNPRGMDSIRGWAQDQMMREEYKINEAKTPEILSRTGINPTTVSRETAAQVYDRVVNQDWQEFQRQFQDAFQPVRIAIEAIQQETGNIPIEDYENYLLIQNQMSSRSRVEIDEFARKQYSPIIEQVNAIINKIMEMRNLDVNNREQRAEVYKEVRQYLIAKHGLERNKYYQTHKTRTMTAQEMKPELKQAKQDYDDKVNQINADTSLSDAERQLQLRDALDEYNAIITEIKTREVPDLRDYSGLTSLFGLESKEWVEAERQAKEKVDDFEKALGRIDDDATGNMISQSEDIENLWKRINSATDKTLRHSYESGLLSRKQYEDIKAMFDFYIPLRGFDEVTAEDVYSYARFEGNRFNPAVQTAKGRTSVADDPIAIIMNMAESEIAQGNKNRAKQALYNYLLNRASENNKQNSLMQLEDVWYVISTDSKGNKVYQIAAPDHANGETYEEFEARMEAKAANGEAEKSAKGKVDIGYRFQKKMNENAHYVYLKVNGVDKAIFINGDPKAADAINGRYQKEIGEGARIFRDAQRVISSFFTNYSLEFTARNYFRDMLYAHINIGIRESDSAYRKKFRQNWRHNNMGTMIKMLNAYRAGEYDGRALTADEAAFVEFMKNGGQTGYTLINSVENHKKDLQRAIERMQNGIVKGGVKDSTIFKYTLGSIELLNEASELVTRFAAFKTSRDMGRGINSSIKDAKEVTVNFNTKGAQDGQSKMGAVARYFGWSKYFFNASVQGVQNIKAMRDANKLKFGTTVGGIMAAGFLMPVFVSAISALLGGDDEEEYWNIPEYERQNNFCVPLGNGKYVKVPLPIGFREIYGMGDIFAASLMDKKFNRNVGQIGMDMANKIATIILPINPLESASTGLNAWQTLAYTAAPSSGQFIIQNMTNTDWKGTPLQKEYTYNENDPQWMKAFASNPDWMTGLSKWCNEHINLDGDYKGMDWSPEKLDNTLSNLLGGVYTLIKKTGKTMSMIWNEENRNLSNVPLGGVILGSGIDSDDRFVTDAYHDMKDFYDDNLNYIKRRAEKFGYDLEDVFLKEKGKHHPKMLEIYENKNFDFMQEWYKGNQELDELNREIKKLKKEIAGKEHPSEALLNKLAKKQDKFDAERRDFVNDMLELD